MKKKFLSFITTIFLLTIMGSYCAMAQTFTVGNLKYRIKVDPEGNTYAYVYDFKSSGMPSKLTIPATVWHNGVIYPVYAIDDNDPGAIGENGTNALWNVTCDTLDLGDGINMVGRGACVSSHLKHVIFGTHLWYIGWSAFSGHCVNVSGPMVFPNTLQIIDHWAFHKYGKNGNITGNLVLPASLCSLGAHAFEEARIPGRLIFAGDQLAYINVGTFKNSAFTGALELPEHIYEIKEEAFWGCEGITSITTGGYLTTIGEQAFAYCNHVDELYLGSNVSSIGDRAFYMNSTLDYVVCNAPVPPTLGEDVFVGIATDHLTVPAGCFEAYYNSEWHNYFTFIQEGGELPQFVYNNLKYGLDGTHAVVLGPADGYTPTGTLTIPSQVYASGSPVTVTQVGDYAFSSCSGITSVSLPNTIKRIGAHAFGACSHLTSLTLPNGLEYIGDGAFFGCYGITSNLVIPNTVTHIGNDAFNGCWGLTGSLVIPNSVEFIGELAFRVCGFNGTLQLGNSLEFIGNYAFVGTSFTGSLTIPNSVLYIGDSAFATGGLTGNDEGQFSGTLTLGDHVQYIGEDAFYNCKFTGSLTIPNSVTEMGESAFYRCDAFDGDLTIGDGLETIPAMAFCRTGFQGNLTLGEHIRTIDSLAFTGDRWNNAGNYYPGPRFHGTLVLPNTLETIGYNAFSGSCYYIVAPITIPNSVRIIKQGAFTSNSFNGITIGSSVEYIGTAAFYNDSYDWHDGLKEINSLAVVPPTLGDVPFSNWYYGDYIDYVPITVPCGSGPAYQAAGWGTWFEEILEECDITKVYIEDYTAPVWGEHPDFDVTVPSTANYSITSVSWYFEGSESFDLTSNDVFNRSDGNYYMGVILSPATGHSFTENVTVYFNGDASICDAPYNMITSNGHLRVYTINYHLTNVPQTYTITTEVNPVGAGSVSGGGSNIQEGSVITLTAIANPGYTFDHWQDGNTDNPRIITVTADATYTATFTHDQYTIQVVASPASGGTVGGGGTFYYGEQATLTATPNANYAFVGWSDGSNENPHVITVTGSATYTATFGEIGTTYYTVSADVSPANAGIVHGAGAYPAGTSVTLKAEANEGYVFDHWNDDITNNPRIVTVNSNMSFTAYFITEMYTITANASPSNGGRVTGGGRYGYGETATLQATANSGFTFQQWSDGNRRNPRSVIVTGDATYTALFLSEGGTTYTLTVTSAQPALGSVSGSGTYAAGSPVEIRAYPNSNARFVKWNDGNTENPRTVIVNGDLSFAAHFEEVQGYTIEVVSANPEMGAAYGGGTFALGAKIDISAVPFQGYNFTCWQDGNSDNPRTITVTGNATYKAMFRAGSSVTHTVTLICNPDEGSVVGGGVYVHGSLATIQAVPNHGYTFSKWSDDNTENPRTFTVNSDVTLVAFFGTGVDENELANVEVYPNPANETIRIAGIEANSEAKIYNSLGALVMVVNVSADDEISIRDLSSGLYLIRCGNTTLRFVKQ